MESSNRREFLKGAGAFAALASGQTVALSQTRRRANIFVLGTADALVKRAAASLSGALQEKGVPAEIRYNLDGIHEDGERIVIAPSSEREAQQIAGSARVKLPAAAESVAIVSGRLANEPVLLASGPDTRGRVYAALELADRVRHASDPVAELRSTGRSIEQPANAIRSVARLFVSDIEDKQWFYDKKFWSNYLSMLIAQRFNRFSLTLGLGYDLPKRVLDSYFIFAYPYLLSIPGYQVTVRGLAAGEPARNLAMLQWISSEVTAVGLDFQLGLWSHAYQVIDSPNVNYVIEGLTPANHAAYCRDALRTLLRECPAISGLTLRAHSESGIPDGSYDFWKVVFQGAAECGRRVELDLHSKGIDFKQVQMALDTGQPVRISPKLTAEHGGLPAHQIAIREQERRHASSTPQARSFTRYGYADYLAEDRPYGVYFRLWPGMQKLLLWGDPAIAAGYGRSASFCGSLGLEYCEPLSFKGRQGSGHSPDRPIYADDSLRPQGGDWRKYAYTYRLWGRLLYDPAAKPDSWRRYLRHEFGPAAEPVENSLRMASRAVPLFTSAHLPSGAGMSFWPELYTNMPIGDATIPHPFTDTPSPKVFGRVSPLDPGLFSSAHDFIEQMTGKRFDGRYSPVEVAQWLETAAKESERHLADARTKVRDAKDASFRRADIDLRAVQSLATFWAHKMRAAVAWSLFEANGDLDALRDSVYYYRLARASWTKLVETTRGVYVADVSFGAAPQLRGHWADRLPAIDRDLQFMERQLREKAGESAAQGPSAAAAKWLLPRPAMPVCRHVAPASFRPGQSVQLELASPDSVTAVRLHYRHVNQAEAYETVGMTGGAGHWRQSIPAEYTNSKFPLLYYFEVHSGGDAWLYPGLDATLSNQPYYVVRRAARA
jgi:hypothetical protein